MTDKAAFYRELLLEAEGLFTGEYDLIANAANLSALLWLRLADLNWAGFYFLKAGELVLGPFQGKPACVRIAMGKGVCGTAAAQKRSQIVPDVHAFAGHIACDGASNSELVVPLLVGEAVIGVIDLDSPRFDRFDGEDEAGIEALARVLMRACG